MRCSRAAVTWPGRGEARGAHRREVRGGLRRSGGGPSLYGLCRPEAHRRARRAYRRGRGALPRRRATRGGVGGLRGGRPRADGRGRALGPARGRLFAARGRVDPEAPGGRRCRGRHGGNGGHGCRARAQEAFALRPRRAGDLRRGRHHGGRAGCRRLRGEHRCRGARSGALHELPLQPRLRGHAALRAAGAAGHARRAAQARHHAVEITAHDADEVGDGCRRPLW